MDYRGHVRFGSQADMGNAPRDVCFTPESRHGVAADTDARTACVSWVRAASTLSPTAWAKHPLDNRARRNSCALLYRIQTLLTVLGALFHFSNCEKANLDARIAD